MKQHGYSLIELLISITIIGITLAGGLSAYTNTRDKQEIRTIGESLEVSIREAQKKASVGRLDDCTGSLTYITLTLNSTTNLITTQAFCSLTDSTPITTTIDNIDITTDSWINFKPLNHGIDLSNGEASTTIDIDFGSLNSDLSHTITITKPGSITYLGTTP